MFLTFVIDIKYVLRLLPDFFLLYFHSIIMIETIIINSLHVFLCLKKNYLKTNRQVIFKYQSSKESVFVFTELYVFLRVFFCTKNSLIF